MKTNRIELNLGLFKGFYGSLIESYVDQNVDNDLNEMGIEYDDANIEYDFNELAKDIFDYSKYELYSDLDFISNMKFKELTSPKYYNYSNDKIYFDCDIDKEKFIDWLIELTTEGEDIWEMVANEIIEIHTSCSGFISFHSNKTKDWIKDLMKFDLEDEKTIYKIGFIISEYIQATKIFQDYEWDFESEYLENNSGVYTCYTINEITEL